LTLADLAQAVGKRLAEKHKTVAVAESCTGGDLSQALSAPPGASAYFLGSVVAYHNDAKVNLLGVPRPTIARHGAVSEETAAAMATACRDRFDSDFAVSITGVAGPSGGTPDKPVGLVFIAAATRSGVRSTRHRFSGDRATVREAAATTALSMVQELLDAAAGDVQGALIPRRTPS
jgi:PncC family amidohydrolase